MTADIQTLEDLLVFPYINTTSESFISSTDAVICDTSTAPALSIIQPNSDCCTENGLAEDFWSDQLYYFEDIRNTDENVCDGQIEDIDIRWCLKV